MLPPSDSLAIRNLFSTGTYTKTALARLFGCCTDTITNVLNRTAEKDVYVRTTNPNNLLIMPYKELIREWLSREDLKIENVYQKLMALGATLSPATVGRAVKAIKHELDLSAIRYETAPGQQGQVDWASFPGYKAIVEGIEKPLYALFLVLGYSRAKYVEFTTEMSCDSLIRCIENGLRYFGGTPKELLFDNMPQVVNRCLREGSSHLLERELVPEFTDFADYCGFDIVLARIRRPQEKGKVERFIGFFKDSFMPLIGKKTGHDLSELNRMALSWCNRVNHLVHGTTGERPFDRLPFENLSPLHETAYSDCDTITVHKDGSVYFRGSVYSVDEKYSDYTGRIIRKGNSIFAILNDELVILGKRKLPVYIRKRYSRTNQSVKGRKRSKPIRTSSIAQWIPSAYGPIQITRRFIHEHFAGCSSFGIAGV